MSEVCEQQLSNPNPLLYDDALWDAAKGDCSYFRTNDAVHVLMVSCTISALSSMLIIYTIFISSTKLSSIYHRIIFAMSICDVIGKFANGLATLPYPARGKDKWTDIINIPGPRIGNVHTCTAQGFIAYLCMEGYFCYFICLLVYYLFAMVIKMSEENMEKYLEPFFHGLSISLALYNSVPPLLHGDYNPSNIYSSCWVTPKPWFCENEDNAGVDCVRGKSAIDGSTEELLRWNFIIVLIILCTICTYVFISDRNQNPSYEIMPVKPHTFRRKGRLSLAANHTSTLPQPDLPVLDETTALLRPSNERHTIGPNDSSQEDQYQETKTVMSHALLYAIAAVLPNTYYIIYSSGDQSPSNMFYLSVLYFMTFLDGLYNLFIFVYHKVHNLKVSNPSMSTKEAIIDVFTNGGIHDAIIITEIDMVREYHSTMIQDHTTQQDIVVDHNLHQQTLDRAQGIAMQLGSITHTLKSGSSISARLGSPANSPTSVSYVPSTSSTNTSIHHGNGRSNFSAAVGEVDNWLALFEEEISLAESV